jgi:hypothetical protein
MTDSADIVGFNQLLEGDSGTGKTYALGTLVETGLDVFTLFLESGQETLYGYFTDKGNSIPDNLHVHRLRSTTASFKELLDSAKKTNTLPHKTLSEMLDPYRNKYDFYLSILDCLNNFVDQRTGQSFGPVDDWGVDRVLVIDGLSGINRAAMQLVIGGKAVRSQAEWGQAQFYVEELLHKLCNGCRCHFVLIAHQELEQDPLGGGSKKTVATLGKALAPKIPQLFSDVVLAVKQGDKFMWSTADTSCALKNRNLSLSGQLPPSFAPVYAKWKSRMYGDK